MKIVVESNVTEDTLERLGVYSWGIWEKEESQFPWHYDSEEVCYVLAGRVTVKTEYETVTFGKGDLVTFPAGLDCEWVIHEAILKHYSFR